MIDLQEIQDYLFCSLWFYLKHRPSPLVDEDGKEHTVPTYSTLDLPGLAITQALDAYASGSYPEPFPELVRFIWEAWFQEKGVGDDVLKSIQAYAGIRNEILAQFTGGKITNRDHKPYTEPRMTLRYKEMMENAGLAGLVGPIDAAALEKMGCVAAEMAGIGPYPLADAYADTLFMASRFAPPPPQAIYGLHVRTVIPLSNHQAISATADLVILGRDTAIIEVHDFFPAFRWERAWVGRRLDVIAGLSMTAADPERPFPKVEKVVYRHFLSGKTLERRSVRQARLVFALEAVEAWDRSRDLHPRVLIRGPDPLPAVPGPGICIPASGDILEWFLPGESDTERPGGARSPADGAGGCRNGAQALGSDGGGRAARGLVIHTGYDGKERASWGKRVSL